jgi:hypothetical protein
MSTFAFNLYIILNKNALSNLVFAIEKLHYLIAKKDFRKKRIDKVMGDPQIIQAYETVLNQAGRKNVDAPDDGPKLVEAMREVAKQAKEKK